MQEVKDELIAHLCGLDPDGPVFCAELDDALFEKYEIERESFDKLIYDLLPLIQVGYSPLTEIKYKGFADIKNNLWLMKVPVNDKDDGGE